jgi:GTP cyclohydrolase I
MDFARAEWAVRELLAALGRDVDAPGLRKTPHRVVKAWAEMLGGYSLNADDVTRTSDGEHFDGEGYDQAIVMREIAFVSACEHHVLPFYGKAHVAYVPGESRRVLGASKLARLVDMHARRLQLQERLTRDVAADLLRVVDAAGVAVVVEATHLCMCARGVRRDGAQMVTSEMLGVFRDKPEARAEVMALLMGGRAR